jgi:hemolysin-activating ACP:hemolysin acyltransferase
MTEQAKYERDATLAQNLSERVHPILAGQSPQVQGAVLADLLATWLAGHAPQIRKLVLTHHIDMMMPLIEVNERIIFGDDGHPAGRVQ